MGLERGLHAVLGAHRAPTGAAWQHMPDGSSRSLWWVAYMDIIGFKDVVSRAQDNEEVFTGAVRDLTDALSKVQGRWSSVNDDRNMAVFSDTIVAAWPLFSWEAGQNVVADVSTICCDFLQMGFFLRGAIAPGRHHMDGSLIFSPSLIAAYQAESQEAFYPRVLCDDVCTDPLVGEHYASLPQSLKDTPVRPHDGIWRDWDGRSFVNYLHVVGNEGTHPSAVLTRHRDLIAEGLNKHTCDLRKRAKYGWLASYHNRFCLSRNLSDEYLIKEAPSQGPVIER